MSRGVSVPRNALVIAYREMNAEDIDDFDMVIEDYRETVKSMFPSTYDYDKWVDREDHVVARNNLVMFGLSQYGSVVSYWIIPLSYPMGFPGVEDLAIGWSFQIRNAFEKAFGNLRHSGHDSSGSQYYYKKER